MRDSQNIVETELQAPQQDAAGIDVPPAIEGFQPVRDGLTSVNWPEICFGIVLAGGVYPIAVVALWGVLIVAVFTWNALGGVEKIPNAAELPVVAFTMGMTAIVAGVIGLIYSSLVTILTTPFVYLFVRSLKLRGDVIFFGAVWGGLVGFVAVLPIAFSVTSRLMFASNFFSDVLLPLSVGPGLTTIFGQLGGAWGGARARRRDSVLSSANRWRATPAQLDDRGFPLLDGGAPRPPIQRDRDTERPRLQFGIRHLLWITVWLSVFLSVIRLSGIPFQYVLPLLLGWLAYQSATLYLGWRIIRRWPPKWIRPQTPLAGRVL